MPERGPDWMPIRGPVCAPFDTPAIMQKLSARQSEGEPVSAIRCELIITSIDRQFRDLTIEHGACPAVTDDGRGPHHSGLAPRSPRRRWRCSGYGPDTMKSVFRTGHLTTTNY